MTGIQVAGRTGCRAGGSAGGRSSGWTSRFGPGEAIGTARPSLLASGWGRLKWRSLWLTRSGSGRSRRFPAGEPANVCALDLLLESRSGVAARRFHLSVRGLLGAPLTDDRRCCSWAVGDGIEGWFSGGWARTRFEPRVEPRGYRLDDFEITFWTYRQPVTAELSPVAPCSGRDAARARRSRPEY